MTLVRHGLVRHGLVRHGLVRRRVRLIKRHRRLQLNVMIRLPTLVNTGNLIGGGCP